MSTIAAALRPIPLPTTTRLRTDPAAAAFTLLRVAFTVAPILFGLDKFVEVLNGDWTIYLASEFNDVIPGSAEDAMYLVGAVEIAAGLVVAIAPRFGGFGDIALRDFGLLIGAVALSLLAIAYGREDDRRAHRA